MKLSEFEKLSEPERLEAWQRLSQEERDSIVSERRARQSATESSGTSSIAPEASSPVTRKFDPEVPSPAGITRFQGAMIITLLLAALGFPVFSFLRPVQQWEYRIESPSDTGFTITMDRYGQEGWELVTARRASDSTGSMSYECIFKRPKK